MWGSPEVRTCARSRRLRAPNYCICHFQFPSLVLGFFPILICPQRAIHLNDSDPLTTILLQISGPAHIPWQDQRWQELLHGYEVWVHVEHTAGEAMIQQQKRKSNSNTTENNDSASDAPAAPAAPRTSVLQRACQSIVQHSPRSSNLAAFCMHVTKMLSALKLPSTSDTSSKATDNSAPFNHNSFSNRIALVGKARVIAGALNLLRILVHAVMAHSVPDAYYSDAASYRADCFCYRSRREGDPPQHVGDDLMQTLLTFLCHTKDAVSLFPSIPELYDTTTFVVELILVLLSTQLYQPIESSFQRQEFKVDNSGLFWRILREQAQAQQEFQQQQHLSPSWTPRTLVALCLEWHIQRPSPPDSAIQFHNQQLAKQVVAAKGERRNAYDGLYESHSVAVAAQVKQQEQMTMAASTSTSSQQSGRSKVLLDATKGVLVLSSTIILLPFRLMSLALGLLGSRDNNGNYDEEHKKHFLQLKRSSRTKDVLWLSDSPLADLANSLLLLLINNNRAEPGNNPFRAEMANLSDNRWDATHSMNGLPDLPQEGKEESAPLLSSNDTQLNGSSAPNNVSQGESSLAVNFEGLFGAFGACTHNEVGALLLYSFLQASPSFAEAIAVRSDLDTLVMPILRTLYFSNSAQVYIAHDGTSPQHGGSTSQTKLSIRSCPFRSLSHLYVMIILLLLFSQDSSFGADAFRRVIIPRVPWYKERHLKSISLGSIIVLSMLRALTFNLNRLQDPFLMSNCCAVLMNLCPSIVELHEYAAMRLVAVTVLCMKRYAELVKKNPASKDSDDLTDPIVMHGEVARTLMQVVKHCTGSKNLDRNLYLTYALVYHLADFKRVINDKGTLALILRRYSSAGSS